MRPAGADWVQEFPTSVSLDELASPFRECAEAFVDALEVAGATVAIAATYRPPERAYLMHWCCLVAGYYDEKQIFHRVPPGYVPAMAGVDIDWTCVGNLNAARAAAAEMRKAYGIVYPAALESRHTQRLAIDMTIQFDKPIEVMTKDGDRVLVTQQSGLWAIGATYGVHKLPSDPPHWSSDGH